MGKKGEKILFIPVICNPILLTHTIRIKTIKINGYDLSEYYTHKKYKSCVLRIGAINFI